MTLVPSHAEPAGHSTQLVRVVAVPPDVNEPTGHGLQRLALFALQKLSSPHCSHRPALARNQPARQNSHCVEPAVETVPAGHGSQLEAPCSGEKVPDGHLVWVLEPSHEKPAGHGLHAVRVVGVPSDVNEPTGHFEHRGALFALHMSSAPHL